VNLEHVTEALALANYDAGKKTAAILLDPPLLEALPSPDRPPVRRAYGCRALGCYAMHTPETRSVVVLLILEHPRWGKILAPKRPAKKLPPVATTLILSFIGPAARIATPLVAAVGSAIARDELRIYTLKAAEQLASS